MTIPDPPRRLTLDATVTEAGAVHEAVRTAQRLLSRFGYLADADAGRLDAATMDALRRFQTAMRLPPSGVLDAPTADALTRPRCGLPDPAGMGATFTASGCRYPPGAVLKYAFLNDAPELPPDQVRAAIRRALATWKRHVALDFVEVAPTEPCHLRFAWYAGPHGDTNPFAKEGETLAHAFFPPPCHGPSSGACHFDASQPWSLTGHFDVETVALHEIGHMLGLDHTGAPDAVMFPGYTRIRRELSADDIAGIRAIYHPPTLRVLVHLQDLHDRVFRDGQMAGTKGESRRLEGFQIDFDPPVPGLGMRYMAHLQDVGDTAWATEGRFVGTRGQSRRLEGFAIQLTGPLAAKYDVRYKAHLQGIGDTAASRNGAFCGTRGESRRLEAIFVQILPKAGTASARDGQGVDADPTAAP